jgi:hypothetical protein
MFYVRGKKAHVMKKLKTAEEFAEVANTSNLKGHGPRKIPEEPGYIKAQFYYIGDLIKSGYKYSPIAVILGGIIAGIGLLISLLWCCCVEGAGDPENL